MNAASLGALTTEEVEAIGLENLVKQLGSQIELGLGHREASRSIYGSNRLPKRPSPSLLSLMLRALQDRTLTMLCIAATISLAIGIYEDIADIHKLAWIEGVAIMLAVIAVVLVNSINDYEKEKQFRKLSDINADRPVTIQGGDGRRQVSVFDMLVGDLVHLQPGDIIPADGVAVVSQGLVVDESSSTGESRSISKTPNAMLLSETKVLDGTGLMLATAVGVHSFHGKMMMAMRTGRSAVGAKEGLDDATPLQKKLDQLAERIAMLGSAAALLMLLALVIKFIIEVASSAEGTWTFKRVLERILSIVIQTITVVVVAVPEGLPMAVTISLAYACTRMLQDNNLVRILAACETMGTATCICTDKTGTLTENRMSVVDGVVLGARVTEGFVEEKKANVTQKAEWEAVRQCIAVNSVAYHTDDGFVGSSTEAALLAWLGEDFSELRKKHMVFRSFPFSSERKSMTTIIRLNEDMYRVLVKGASEIVLEKCQLREESRRVQEQLIVEMAGKGLRTVTLAYRDYARGGLEHINLTHAPLEGLHLLGVVGIADPLRKGVAEAVQQCHKAGIFIRMVTGDNLVTATSIAQSAGILQPGGVVMDGARFRELSDEGVEHILPRLQVLARSSPMDKQRMVQALRRMSEVVAVTGDGTNDGPALHAANVGFSMGIAGTEVAKAASSIILMDDNFASIIRAVAWGRCVNEAVRKFLQFQLTVNVAAVVVAFVSSLFDPEGRSVLTAVQLLWLNLVMDTLGALALATEGPTPDLLARHPDSPNLRLITRGMWRMIIVQSLFQVAVVLLLLFVTPFLSWSDAACLDTIVFNCFVWMQLFNELNSRILTHPAEVRLNPLRRMTWTFAVVWLGCAVLQVLIVECGGRPFNTRRLGMPEWLLCLGIALLSIPLAFITRLFSLSARSDETAVFQSPARLRWQSAVHQVRSRLAVYEALRGTYTGKRPVSAIANE